MDVKLVGIEHTLDLETGQSTGFLAIRLPDGNMARVVADDELLNHIQGLLGSSEVRPTQRMPSPSPPQEVYVEPTPAPASPPIKEAGILWSKLPASVLSETMKESFIALGIVEPLTKDQLTATVKEVRQLALAQMRDNPPSPAVGQVMWSDSPPMNQRPKVPIRFQQATDNGYPIPPAGVEIGGDPGEVMDADEDGVSQG